MVQPAVHPTTLRWWEGLGQGFTGPDKDERLASAWHLLSYMEAIGAILGVVDDLVRDTEDGPGWTGVFDVDRAAPQHLGYLAQFIGARLVAGLDDAQQRDRIRNAEGWGRGRPAAIIEAARAHLVGTRQVILTERAGDQAYLLQVTTFEAETPDPGAVEASIRLHQKPGAIVLQYVLAESGTYDQLGAAFGTFDDLGAAIPTFADLDDWVPP